MHTACRDSGWRGALTVTIVVLAVAAAFLSACTPQPAQAPPSESLPASFIVESDWLAGNRAAKGLLIVDLRAEGEYRQGHIPGAVSFSLGEITDAQNPVRGMVAPKPQMENAMRRLGVNRDSVVVIYDEGDTPSPGRLFWALHYYGMERVAVLNGGYAQWQKQGLPLETKIPSSAPGNFVATPNASRIADKAYVKARLGAPGAVILDVRSPGEYDGSTKRSQRVGHIPGAINAEWVNNLVTQDGVAKLKPAAELRRMYEGLGVTPNKEIIVHCQTGVRAAQTYLALRYLGYGQVRLYDGSWEEWGNDASLPIEAPKASDSDPMSLDPMK